MHLFKGKSIPRRRKNKMKISEKGPWVVGSRNNKEVGVSGCQGATGWIWGSLRRLYKPLEWFHCVCRYVEISFLADSYIPASFFSFCFLQVFWLLTLVPQTHTTLLFWIFCIFDFWHREWGALSSCQTLKCKIVLKYK